MYTADLLMLHLTQFIRESVFFIDRLNCCVIDEVESDTIILYDVFSTKPVDRIKACEAFGSGIKKVKFAFTPKEHENNLRFSANRLCIGCIKWQEILWAAEEFIDRQAISIMLMTCS